MNLFDFNDYKSLTLAWIQTQPKSGRGQLQKMAKNLSVGSTFMSQVFRGDRDLTLDQALRLCDYCRMSQLERDFYILLVQKARAATIDLRNYTDEKLKRLRRKSETLKKRIDVDKELTEIEQARFYSSWHYAAIRNLLALPGDHTTQTIAVRLNLEPTMIDNALDFLLESGLCVMQGDRITAGPKFTHLGANSPLVKARQVQWRLKAFEAMDRTTPQSLFYTCPMSLSAETKKEIRTLLLQTIQDALALIKQSPSEELACLNIDWFSF